MKKRLTTLGAALGVSALLLSACGGSGGNGGDGKDGGGSPVEVSGTKASDTYEGQEGGEITFAGCNPQDLLIPGFTQETCGGDVLDSILVGLTEVDPSTGKPRLANAESIEANDKNTKFTVKLKDWKFDDGSPVTAESYVDAWNWGANGANGAKQQAFFGPGFLDVKGYDKVAESKDKKATMEGLEVVDDKTFTVETTNPNSLFETMVVHSTYMPLPEPFFKDHEAYGKKPIGNGPFKLTEYKQEQQIVLEKNTDYQGEAKAHVDKLTFKMYTEPGAAYADVVAGNVDYVDAIPPDAVAGNKWQTDLGEGRWQLAPSTLWNGYSFPLYDEKFKDPKVRQAISMAIDRQAVTDAVTNGENTPGTAWSPPGIEPFQDDVCGDKCHVDGEAAKKLLEEGGGFDGTLTIAFNNDGPGNKEVTEAVCTSINENLGIDCQPQSFPTFAEMLDKIDAKEMTGMYRSGWQADFPSPLSYLTAYYITDAGSNKSGYSNPEVDKMASEILSQDEAQQEATFKKMQETLAEDMPVTPLWYGTLRLGWSDKVVAPQVTWKSTIDFTTVGLKK